MNFLNIVYNNNFLLEEENLYKIFANIRSGDKSKPVRAEVARNLSKEDLVKLKNAELPGNIVQKNKNSSSYYTKPSAYYLSAVKISPTDKSKIDKNLYILKYIAHKPISIYKTRISKGDTLLYFLYISDNKYEEVIDYFKKKNIPKEYYKLYEASVEDIINIYLQKNEDTPNILPKHADTEDVKTLAERIAIDLGASIRAKKEKESKEEYSKEEREEAMSYLNSGEKPDLYVVYEIIENIKDNNDIIYNNIVEKEKKEIAKKEKIKNIEKLINIIKGYDASDRIKDTIFYVFIFSKFKGNLVLERQIEAAYKGEKIDDDNIEKVPSAQKKEKQKKDNTYTISFFDDSQNFVKRTEKLSDEEYKKLYDIVEKNKKKFLDDKNQYDKIKKEWDKYENDMVLYKQLKKGQEPKKPSSTIPNISVPSKYGILKIEKKEIYNIKNNKKKSDRIEELSATGGVAAPGTGASVTSGSGEGVATKYAFAKKPKIVRKKFEFKNEAKMIFWESVRGLFKNR